MVRADWEKGEKCTKDYDWTREGCAKRAEGSTKEAG